MPSSVRSHPSSSMSGPSSADAPKIKGAALLEILKWYGVTHGPSKLNEAATDMPSHLRQYIPRPGDSTLGLLAGTWYPAELVARIFSAMTSDLSSSQVRQLAQDSVKASVGTTLSGIYAGVIRLLVSPKMLADHYQKIWRLYHNTGEFKVIIRASNEQEFRLSNWPVHDTFLCLMNVYATKLILELIGMKEVNGHLAACVSKGDAYCSYVQRWKG